MRISDWSSDVCSSDLALENWVIAALSRIGIAAYPVPDRLGIWTRDGGEEAKIGAIGVRVRKWVTLHGFSVNITPDLAHFGGIVPCGLPDYPVTRVAKLGHTADFANFDAADRKRNRLNYSH